MRRQDGNGDELADVRLRAAGLRQLIDPCYAQVVFGGREVSTVSILSTSIAFAYISGALGCLSIMEFACSFVPKLAGGPAVQIRFTQTSRAGWRLKQHTSQTRSFRTSTAFFREAPGGAPTKVRGQRKVFDSVDEAVADIKSGSTILSAGFGLCGTAETIIGALAKRGPESLHSLTAVSNNAGTAIGGGLSPLITGGQVSKAICSFLGNNKALEKKYLNGEIAIELTPQGTLAEKLRCGGAGIPVRNIRVTWQRTLSH